MDSGIRSAVSKAIAEILGRSISPTCSLLDHVDSIQLLELYAKLEQEYGIVCASEPTIDDLSSIGALSAIMVRGDLL